MVHHCLEVANELIDENIDVEVVDLRTVRPIDEELVLESAKKKQAKY